MDQRLSKAAARTAASARLPACLGVVGVIALCLVPAAQAEVVNKTARPGQRIFLNGFTYYFSTQGCRSQAASIELVQTPRGGRVEQRREFRILSGKTDETGAPITALDGCEGAKKDSMSLYYTARPDFSGLDTLSVTVTYGDGSTLPYTFRIRVPEGERRQAPVATRAPVRRDGPAAGPRDEARIAPAAREASTVDFLRDTVRQAARPPATADAAASAGGAESTAQPVPRAVAPPQPRPSAQPQL